MSISTKGVQYDPVKASLRAARFATHLKPSPSPSPPPDSDEEGKVGEKRKGEKLTKSQKRQKKEGYVIGICTAIEKDYLRLTSAPDPSNVRPMRVLQLSLQNVKDKWTNESNYEYSQSQLKSIRQDLVIQGIRNNFTVHVYETHCRIALEEGDLNEFNQCQTQLQILYKAGMTGNEAEFAAYYLLYNLYMNHLDVLIQFRSFLSPHVKKAAPVKHALDVITAVNLENYHSFFIFYRKAPLMSGYLMDFLVLRIRNDAYRKILGAYRPTVPVNFLHIELGLLSLEDTMEFLTKNKAVFVTPEKDTIDTLESKKNI